MSGVILKGNISGQVELNVPDVAGTNVINVAPQTGTLHVAAPAFRAQEVGGQTITLATATKITLSETQTSECFDTNNCFASSRFTPTVAGYYQVNTIVGVTLATSIASVTVYAFKNGNQSFASAFSGSSSTSGYASASGVIYLNGTTDYIELYGRGTGTGTVTVISADFSAALIRGA